ncbi:MAG: hypothetical protein V1719_00425 [Patescibacteria group bacterium]
MSKTIYRKTKWQISMRVFSWFLSFSVILAFVLGFTPFNNQDIQVAKATTLTSIYAESAAPSTTTSTTTYSTKLTGANFVSGNKYFIYVTLGLTHSSATGQVNYQIVYNTTTLYTGILEPAEATVNYYTQVDWMDVYTPSANGNLYVKFKGVTAGTTTAANAVLTGLDLTSNDIIENYDYYFNENTTGGSHTNGYQPKASITLSNADGVKDWLVFATEHITINNAAKSHVARFHYNDGTSYYSMDRNLFGENVADDYSFVLLRGYNNIPRNTEISIQVKDANLGGDENYYNLSRIFALNLQVFRDRSAYYSDTDIALATYASWTTLKTTAYTASSTGSHLVFASYINNVAATDARSNSSITVDGTTYPPNWDWTDGAGGRGKTSYDASDETSNNIVAALTMSAGARSVVFQAQEVGAATAQVADEITMTIFSAEFNYRPQINNWQWYADEEDTTPGTAYAAENTAPPQVEMGKSIGFKLRINLTEVGGLAENNNRKKLYYATSTAGPWTEVGTTTDLSAAWRYYDAGGSDNGVLPSVLLTGSSSTYKGIHNESNSDSPSNSDHVASTTTEFEYCIENYDAAVSTTYYFGLFDQTTGLIALASGKSFPSLTTASAYNLSLETAPSAVYLGSWQIGSSEYHSYTFGSLAAGEEITMRDNRGQSAGNSAGWTLSADITTELYFQSVAGYCGSVTFTGSGLNDMTIFSCDNTLTSQATYKVEISDTAASPDAFVWYKNGAGVPSGAGECGSAVLIEERIYVAFANIDGHTVADYWEFTAYPAVNITIAKANMYWITNTITGLYDAPTTGITTPGGYMSSAVTAATVSGSGKQGLGGFEFLPTLRIYNASTAGDYTGGVMTFTLA